MLKLRGPFDLLVGRKPGVRTERTRLASIGLVWFGLALANPAVAQNDLQPTPRPDAKGLTVPALQAATTPSGVRDYMKFFVYWRQNTTYEEAFSDLDDCRVLASQVKIVGLPVKYAPLGTVDVFKPDKPAPQSLYGGPPGIVEYAIGAYFIDRALKDGYREAEKRCMAYKGYSRYGVSGSVWKQIMQGEQAQALARRALIAAGPRPTTEGVDP